MNSFPDDSHPDSEFDIGISPAMRELRHHIEKVAPTDARVLIFGESGTGKELAAALIHRLSKRAQKPFVQVNCAAIPSELIESELFGYERGAFTGANQRKIGLIEEANGGTLFLDEIGDMALTTQAKVLRALQENTFLRVGGTQAIPFDARILAATNKNLRDEIRFGRFRKDLFFRLYVIPITIAPLRERTEDIEILANQFLEIANQSRAERKILSPEVLAIFRRYPWPGNVRELKNVVERLSIMLDGEVITADDLRRVMPDIDGSAHLRPPARSDLLEDGQPLREKLLRYEKMLLEEAFRICKGNISEMARILKTDRPNLHRKLARFGIR